MQFVPRSYCPCGTLLFVALLITPGMAENVVWLPRSSAGQRLAEELGAVGGVAVSVTKAADESNTSGGVA